MKERDMRELLYKYGRGDFRTFDEGIEREWLMTNGIGGFANQSIIGANQRIFSGYLIAMSVKDNAISLVKVTKITG